MTVFVAVFPTVSVQLTVNDLDAVFPSGTFVSIGWPTGVVAVVSASLMSLSGSVQVQAAGRFAPFGYRAPSCGVVIVIVGGLMSPQMFRASLSLSWPA